MLNAVAHLPHGRCSDDARGLLEAAHDGFHRAVANRMEARLDARSGARNGVVTDLAGSQIGESAGVQVRVGRAQAGGVRADCTVREEVAGRAQGTQLAGPLYPTELAPVGDDLRMLRL